MSPKGKLFPVSLFLGSQTLKSREGGGREEEDEDDGGDDEIYVPPLLHVPLPFTRSTSEKARSADPDSGAETAASDLQN